MRRGDSQRATGKRKRTSIFGLALRATLFAFCPPVNAQSAKKMARIGLLGQSNPSFASPQTDALREGLRELGYVDGKNILFERRYAEGELDHLPDLARELVRLKVDIIVASSTPGILAAKNSTTEITPTSSSPRPKCFPTVCASRGAVGTEPHSTSTRHS